MLFSRLLRIFFICLLAASSLAKLADMPGFYAVIRSYQLLALDWVAAAGWLLVAVELLLAVWLCTGKGLVWSTGVLVGLHVVYFVWLSIALLRGLNIPNCGCFGVYFPRPLTPYTLLEDVALLTVAGLMWVKAGKKLFVTSRRLV